ncbi:MAG: ATP-binding protein [Gammaproteobacteria bacterium]|nr:ATP-binding protein [Gammaproteobacteria bacterium]MBK81729.1 ATP-binding protein [Gammaproteobacteria bacterium]|tara:strand:- start:19023 stop:20102 length:1080 start_codon:yes stop_codon:yes gene_type:complete
MREQVDQILAKTPGMRARQIAKELDVPRKEINSILHGNPERYAQNDDYEWRLIPLEVVDLLLPSGWVTADAFETSLRQAGPLLDGTIDSVNIVFRASSKPMIESTARILALANQLSHQGKLVTLDFEAAEKTRTYLDRAGFFDHLDEAVQVFPERPVHSAAGKHKGRSDTLVEFGGVDPEAVSQELINDLARTFVLQSSNEYSEAAVTVFGELINNVVEHSQTDLPGFAGLQKYGGRRKHIQTVVSDSGVGIAQSLRPALLPHYPRLHNQFGGESLESDIGLVSEAMSKGEISRFGSARGLGFKSSSAQAMKFNACFTVRQETFCLKFIYEDGALIRIERQTGLSKLLGTHICFDFYID